MATSAAKFVRDNMQRLSMLTASLRQASISDKTRAGYRKAVSDYTEVARAMAVSAPWPCLRNGAGMRLIS